MASVATGAHRIAHKQVPVSGRWLSRRSVLARGGRCWLAPVCGPATSLPSLSQRNPLLTDGPRKPSAIQHPGRPPPRPPRPADRSLAWRYPPRPARGSQARPFTRTPKTPHAHADRPRSRQAQPAPTDASPRSVSARPHPITHARITSPTPVSHHPCPSCAWHPGSGTRASANLPPPGVSVPGSIAPPAALRLCVRVRPHTRPRTRRSDEPWRGGTARAQARVMHTALGLAHRTRACTPHTARTYPSRLSASRKSLAQRPRPRRRTYPPTRHPASARRTRTYTPHTARGLRSPR